MRKIKRAVCKRIALCKQGKNGFTTLYKSDKTHETAALVKADMDEGKLLVVVAAPGFMDDDGDVFESLEVVEDMAHTHISEGAEIDLEHDGKVLTSDQARLVESFMIQPTDERFAEWPMYDGSVADLRETGGWAQQYQIDDPEIRADYAAGNWNGVSLFGPAAVERVEVKAASKRVAARMGKPQEPTMNEEQLKALQDTLKAGFGEMATLIKSTLAPAEPKPADANAEGGDDTASDPVAPVFSGDPTNAEELATYAKELKAFELNERLRKGEITGEQLAELAKSMAEPSPSDAEAGVEEGDSDEVRGLKVQLFKARKRSAAPAGTGNTEQAELAKSVDSEVEAIAGLLSGSQKEDSFKVV